MQDLNKLILEASRYKNKLITNPDGTPRVYYHGSHEDFSKFKDPEHDWKAHFFTTDKGQAMHYASSRAEKAGKPHGYLHKVHLSATHVLETDTTNNYSGDIQYVRTTKKYNAVSGPTHDGPNNPHHNMGVLHSSQIHHLGTEKVELEAKGESHWKP